MKNMKAKTATLDFSSLGLSEELLGCLKKMNITRPTDVQSQAIPLGLAGNDLIAIAQTGSGKTLAFALVLLSRLQKNPAARGLILTPTRETAQQVYRVCVELSALLPVSNCLLIGGVPGQKQMNQLRKNPRVIVATPGRLNDHLQTNKLLLQNVEVVVIDEADRMLDMGFAPQIHQVQTTLRGQRQTLMFSASFAKNVETLAKSFLRGEAKVLRANDAEAPVKTLAQDVLFMDREQKNDRLLDELNGEEGAALVFTGSQERCDEVGQLLKDYGYASDWIHRGLTQGHRNRVVQGMRDGTLRILVATDLLARGLDLPLVSLVINYDLPFKAEDFLHRIGRTARAGRGGRAVTFITPSDLKMFRQIKPILGPARELKLDPRFKFIDRGSPRSAGPPSDKAGVAQRQRAPARKRGRRP